MGKVELNMEGSTLTIVILSGTQAAQRLPMGSIAHIRHMLAQGPLSAPKVEMAIAEIEDLIMPTLRAVQGAPDLLVSGPELVQLMRTFTDTDEAVPISAVEAVFNQLADIASGSPARLYPLSTAPDAVLGLIVLREVMHHGGFATVAVSQNSSGDTGRAMDRD